jgi:hypothetical protein
MIFHFAKKKLWIIELLEKLYIFLQSKFYSKLTIYGTKYRTTANQNKRHREQNQKDID